MSEDYSKWTLQPASPGASPDEYAGWTLQPAVAAQATKVPSGAMAVLRGAAQGGMLGFADELAGAYGAASSVPADWLYEKLHPEEKKAPGLGQQYQVSRDTYRLADAQAKAAHPYYYGGGEAGGAIASSFIPGLGVAKGASLARALGGGALAGGLAGLGSSEAKDVGVDVLNTLTGAGLGALGGWGGYKLGKFGGKAAEEVRLANADQAELSNKAAQKVFRSARAALGGETTAVLKDFDDMRKVAENAAGVHPADVVAAARAKLADPRYLDVVRNASKNATEVGAERLEGSLASARNVFDSARAGIAPEAIEASAAEAMKNPIRTQVLPRLQTYATRLVPLAVGAHLGGIPGAVMGGVTGAVMGAPGTALANMVRHPATRAAMWTALGGVTRGALEPAARHAPIAEALAMTPAASEKIQAMLAALRRPKEPDYSAWIPAEAP